MKFKRNVIHYFWFGNNPKPEIVTKCIASWKKYMPDWEIKEWNESNYDVINISSSGISVRMLPSTFARSYIP